jgi:AcrR family transcriptional regulator
MANKGPLESALFRTVFDPELTKGQKTKLRIIEAAIECLATLGPEGTNYESIAKRLGLARPHIAYHFKSQAEILHHAFRYITATAQEITIQEVKAAKTNKQQLEAVVRGAFLWAKKYRDQFSVMMLVYFRCTYDEELKKLHTTVRNSGIDRIAAICDIDFGLAASIQSIITGNLITHYATQSSLNLNQWEEATLKAIGAAHLFETRRAVRNKN